MLAPQYVRTAVIYIEINGESHAGLPQRGQPPWHATVGKFLIAGQNMISKVNEWTQWEQAVIVSCYSGDGVDWFCVLV